MGRGYSGLALLLINTRYIQPVVISKYTNKGGSRRNHAHVWVWPRYNHAHIFKDGNMIIYFNAGIV